LVRLCTRIAEDTFLIQLLGNLVAQLHPD
jgi:hypothetical protein